MNDKQIREILIEYLKTIHKELRIYQEKSIGSSVCDLMAVTDRLTGYEIKSDLDDYSRLPSQIAQYNLVFDENYIVVGASHSNSVAEKVPAWWGILVIENDAVTLLRAAEKNTLNSRIHQLRLLWKVELKNLLIRENMPMFTYKSKDYIIGEILAHVDERQIQKHVIYELMHRDYSLFDAKDNTIDVTRDLEKVEILDHIPVDEIVDTLSENDLSRITLEQWIALYRQAKEVQENKEVIFKSEPKQQRTHEIPYTDIEVSPGVPWISKKIISDFIYYLCHGVDTKVPHSRFVNYEPITGCWYITNKKAGGPFQIVGSANSTRMEFTYGLPQYNALQIFEAMLNLREIRLYDAYNRYDDAKTVEALEKQKKIEALFKEWIWRDEDRRWEIEEAYNKLFGSFESHHYDGAKLNFPEMHPKVSLYPYQKDAVQRIISEKNTLLAFDVGAGKTYIMIAAAMKMRQEGLSRKNLFVVPNHIVGQWELTFKAMYPDAKILAIEPKGFQPEARQKILRQMRDGDYDGIIIAYSCFEMIPLSGAYITKCMNRSISRIQDALERVKWESGTAASLKREAEHIKKQACEIISIMHTEPSEVTFDGLEINSLFVDEAHNFKNIPLRSHLRNIAGINIKGSEKCLDMLQKVHCVQETNNGRGVIFATGTPLSNSISDAYAMQMYLQYDVMKKANLDRFDNWVKTFAKPERVCEIDVDTSKFRFKNRFSRFFNLPELSKMFSSISAFYTVDRDGLPRLDGYTDCIIKRSAPLKLYMDELCERTEKIRAKEVDKTKDNMLKVSTDGRKAALDLRLVGKNQPYDETSKIYCCIQNVLAIYKENVDYTQIIFCDISTPKYDKEKFDVYNELKLHLTEAGVSEKEIAFVHSYQTEERKVQLYQMVNEGKVRILIGSTFKLGIGANVQTKLKAIHHLDVPWRPADMVQREGRILRRGNTNGTVQIFRYIAEGSFDAYSWQTLETKQKFISQFLSGSGCARTASDLEENVLTYAQVKALAISEPLMKELAEKQNEQGRLRLLSSGFVSRQKMLAESIPKKEEMLAALEIRYRNTIENEAYLRSLSDDDYKKTYNDIKDILTKSVVSGEYHLEAPLSACGFSVLLPNEQNIDKPYLFLARLDTKYKLKIGDSPSGNAIRIINFLKKFRSVVEDLQQQIDTLTGEIESAKQVLLQSNPYQAKLVTLGQEIQSLQEKVQA